MAADEKLLNRAQCAHQVLRIPIPPFFPRCLQCFLSDSGRKQQIQPFVCFPLITVLVVLDPRLPPFAPEKNDLLSTRNNASITDISHKPNAKYAHKPAVRAQLPVSFLRAGEANIERVFETETKTTVVLLLPVALVWLFSSPDWGSAPRKPMNVNT